MGMDQRDYHQVGPNFGRNGFGGSAPVKPSRFVGAPVVKWLLFYNIAVFVLANLVSKTPWLSELGYFSVDFAIKGGQLWRFLTFQFLHADGMHLLGNMLALFFFGPIVERWWGSKKFTLFYFACGVAGALFYTIMLLSPGLLSSGSITRPMVGASAGIYGILVAVAIIAPNLKVMLYFVLPVSMRFLAIGVLCFAFYQALTDGANAGGEAAHIGGALLGFIFMRNPRLLSFLDSGSVGRKSKRVIDAKVVGERKFGPRVNIDLDDTEVDRILDKVNKGGLQSLTEQEKDILMRSAER